MVIVRGEAAASGAAPETAVPEAPEGIAGEIPEAAMPDLEPVQRSFESALEALMGDYAEYTEKQVTAILDRIALHVSAGDALSLLNVSVDNRDAAAALEQAMRTLGEEAARQVEVEAEKQGMEPGQIHAIGPERIEMGFAAEISAEMITRFWEAAAVGETLRVWSRGRSAASVRADVAAHMKTLTDAYPRMVISGMLTKAQHDGRLRTIMGGPEAALYADEVLDKNTCEPCRKVNRKWIGNASDSMPPLTYPVAGYIHCKGRWRCRGQVIAVWRGGRDWRKWIEQPPQRYSPEG